MSAACTRPADTSRSVRKIDTRRRCCVMGKGTVAQCVAAETPSSPEVRGGGCHINELTIRNNCPFSRKVFYTGATLRACATGAALARCGTRAISPHLVRFMPTSLIESTGVAAPIRARVGHCKRRSAMTISETTPGRVPRGWPKRKGKL